VRDSFISIGLEASFSVEFGENKEILGASAASSRGAKMDITADDLKETAKKYPFEQVCKPTDDHPAIVEEKKLPKEKNVTAVKAIIHQMAGMFKNLCEFAQRLKDTGTDMEVTATSTKSLSISVSVAGAGVSVQISVSTMTSKTLEIYEKAKELWKSEMNENIKSKAKELQDNLKNKMTKMKSFFGKKKSAADPKTTS